ncbi:MAG TPA: glycosyltransferase family 87 protein [Xanthobacteraceae bacterium]|nr:glycosyltransferase family 87 protein [Xanthobacteraceae bacterium]
MLETLRSGDWLNPSRMRLWAIAVLIASLAGIVWLAATANGLNDYQGRPLGTDFSNIYFAGSYIVEGRPAAPFDPLLQHGRAQQIFGEATPRYGWHYPPFFHFVAAPLATLPYLLALFVWQAATLALYLWAIRSITRSIPPPQGEGGEQQSCEPGGAFASGAVPPPGRLRRPPSPFGGGIILLLALAFPAVFVNLGHGHNGFLTAALIGFALLSLDRRPVVAGILFGLLAYKPQFGLLIPLVLLATGRWRALVAAAATVVALTLAVTLAFGVETWRAFFASAPFTRAVLEQGGPGWHLIQSVFSFVRMWGGPVPLAYAAQGALTLGLAMSLVWLWRSRADFELKAAALCLATLLATPYSMDYDMMALAPAIAFLVVHGLRRGFGGYEISALAALWIVPLIARSIAQAALIPLGVIVMLAMLLIVLHRARSDVATAPIAAPAE